MKLWHKIVVVISILILVVTAVLLAFGYRLTISPDSVPDWNAFAAIGTWLIPFAVVYIEISTTKKQRKIEESNASVLNELFEFRNRYKGVIEYLESQFDEGSQKLNGPDFTVDWEFRYNK